MLALPPIFNRFVKGASVTVRSVKHMIIGSSADPGVVDSDQLRKLILQCIVTGSRRNISLFDLKTPPPIHLDNGKSDSGWTYDESSKALSWLLPAEHRRTVIPAGEEAPASNEEVVALPDLWRSHR
jgi:hypothetical protein